jgi:hypothetical protein
MMRTACFVVAFIFAATAPIAFSDPAAAQPASPRECPAKLEGDRQTLVCHCSGEAVSTGSVWGSDVYTDDSQLCRAARHAGAVGGNGGTVRIDARPGQGSYAASTRNGVESSNWGGWARSIIAKRATAADVTSLAYAPSMAICPETAEVLATAGTTLTCRCPTEASSSGSVWGSGPYTTDSAVCRAALHSGLIGPRGGTVTLRSSPGRSSYAGSEANGVSTGDWGSYPTSFEFEG